EATPGHLRPAQPDSRPLSLPLRGGTAARGQWLRRSGSSSSSPLQLEHPRPKAAVVSAPARRLDARRILALPSVYVVVWALTRARQASVFAREYVCALAGHRVLDIGSGPGDLLAELPAGIEYVGFDLSEPYIRAARARFGDRGTFFCRAIDRVVVESLGPASFDLVVSHGVLHHLDDVQADEFFAL